VRRFSVILVMGWVLAGWVSTVKSQDLPAGMRLSAIEVVGAKRLAHADIVSRLGLTIGRPIGLPDLEAAAERLSKTGLVSEVTFRYTYRGSDLTAVFTIVEAAVDASVLFDNFAWFTDQELTKAVADRLPGFDGRVSNTNEAIDQVTGALSGLLKARNLPGNVECFPYLDTTTGSRARLFKVTGVSLPICTVEFVGVQPALEARIDSVARPLIGRDYSRSGSMSFLTSTLRPIYRNLGYLRARVVAAGGRMGTAGSPCSAGVSLSATVEEGVSYAWRGARWTGNTAIASAELDGRLRFKDGEVADGSKLDAGLAAIARDYGRKGYIGLQTSPVPVFDDAARTVTFDISVNEGDHYRMGTLLLPGLEEELANRIRSHWKLKAGEVFDAEYPSEFMKDLLSSEPALRAIGGSAKISTTPGRVPRTVDVTLTIGS
jgi:outer membrane protein assembly factor BamA